MHSERNPEGSHQILMAKPTFCEQSPSCSNEGRDPQSSISGGGPRAGGSLIHERMVHFASTVCKFKIS